MMKSQKFWGTLSRKHSASQNFRVKSSLARAKSVGLLPTKVQVSLGTNCWHIPLYFSVVQMFAFFILDLIMSYSFRVVRREAHINFQRLITASGDFLNLTLNLCSLDLLQNSRTFKIAVYCIDEVQLHS